MAVNIINDYGSVGDEDEERDLLLMDDFLDELKFKTPKEDQMERTNYGVPRNQRIIRHVYIIVIIICGLLLLSGLTFWMVNGNQTNISNESNLVRMNHCVNQSSPVLGGVDVVAYFSLDPESDAVFGIEEYSYNLDGYTFYFSTSKNLALFVKLSHYYIPQFGGFCAYGISSEPYWKWANVKSSGPQANPNSWIIIHNKLYVFMYDLPKALFVEGDISIKIGKGEENWNNFLEQENIDDIYYNQNGVFFNTRCLWWDRDCGHDGNYCLTDYDAHKLQNMTLEIYGHETQSSTSSTSLF